MPWPKDTNAALDRLCKWRSVYAGRLLGTRPSDDIECIAIRDLFEKLILLRVETTTLTALLLKNNIIEKQEYLDTLAEEAKLLDEAFQRAFPGAESSAIGMSFDIQTWGKTTKGWPP